MPALQRKILLLALLPLLLAAGPRNAAAQDGPGPLLEPPHGHSGPSMGALPVFEFHSGFWVNLHHFLYQQARERRSPGASKTAQAAPGGFTEDEQRAWNEAVAFYAANYADRDLQFNYDLTLLKNQLGDFETCTELSAVPRKECDAGLPGKITPILNRAAPVYRKHWWPEHDRANRRWVDAVSPLVQEKSLELARRLAEIYQTRWPKEKIRVEVVSYANPAGAYATLDPLRLTFSSVDPRNQGDAALEMLFHEASYGLAEPVQDAIVRECRQRGKAIPRDLWHALLFYTTGVAVRSALVETPPAEPEEEPEPPGKAMPGTPQPKPSGTSAIREGLYARGWSGYEALLQRYWQPYLDGKISFDIAVSRMVAAL
jgi:hypothetical protein